MSTPGKEPSPPNVDAAEVAKFTSLAAEWWDPTGPFATLHAINPLRLNWIDEHARLRGKKVLDVGCGAGILSEAMALRGASVTGIDAGAEHLEVARDHAIESGVEIDYLRTTAEDFAERNAGAFDVVTCMEMLEHVPDPGSVVSALSRLLAPGGKLSCPRSTVRRAPSPKPSSEPSTCCGCCPAEPMSTPGSSVLPSWAPACAGRVWRSGNCAD